MTHIVHPNAVSWAYNILQGELSRNSVDSYTAAHEAEMMNLLAEMLRSTDRWHYHEVAQGCYMLHKIPDEESTP